MGGWDWEGRGGEGRGGEGLGEVKGRRREGNRGHVLHTHSAETPGEWFL